jgi:hypothetical protein
MSELNRHRQVDEIDMLPLHQCGTGKDVCVNKGEKGKRRHVSVVFSHLAVS